MQRLAAILVMLAVGLALAPPPVCACTPEPVVEAAALHGCCAKAKSERESQGALQAPCTAGCCDPHAARAQVEPPARAQFTAPALVGLALPTLVAASAPTASPAFTTSVALRGPPPPSHTERLALLQLRRC
ncbi:MAG: hypothetical protein R3F39_02090 [Myxococcota bacterium]